MSKGFRGHAIVREHPSGRYRCRCGVFLDGGPLGTGRRGARDVMRFHRLDLEESRRKALEDFRRSLLVRTRGPRGESPYESCVRFHPGEACVVGRNHPAVPLHEGVLSSEPWPGQVPAV